MKYLIKNAKVICKGSSYNGKILDILISNGIISEISKSISDDKATIIKSKKLHVSIGWMDIGTHLGEPGNEHRETMQSLCQAALAGGYTDIAPFPNANPTIQTKSQIENLRMQGAANGIDIHPIGPLSEDTKGENIAEYMDMISAGAVAFSDGLESVQKNGLLMRALQYTKSGDAIVIHHPSDHSIAQSNQVNEGVVSINMGIKGSPDIAEDMIVDRDILLQQYADAKLCIHGISTKGAVQRIKKAKTKSDKIYCAVSYLNLICSEEQMLDYDTNYKVNPVLRTTSDQNALLSALKTGTIDYICSNHVPLEPEAKDVEFPYATSGATGLETLYAAINTKLGSRLSTPILIESVTTSPRKMLNISIPEIKPEVIAKLTCWDPTIEWIYSRTSKKSKSANNPLLDKKLTGKVIATFNGKESYLAK